MDMNMEDIEQEWQEELEEIDAEIAKIFEQLDDPNMSKDTSENTVRDDLLEYLDKVQRRRSAHMARKVSSVKIPGTWNIGDMFYLTYKRIVSYGEDADVPKKRVKCKLVNAFNITELQGETDITNIPLVLVTVNSPLGEALLNKAHTSLRFSTPVGYCEVEVERCYI